MSDEAADRADVAIVGAGPVGTALAILLAQLGRSVVVLERWPEPYALPRAVHFDDEVGRILQACGLGPDLAAISEPAEVYEWRNATGTTLLRFGRTGDGPGGWPQSSMFNQPALEALLAARAEALPGIEVRRGVEVTGLAQDDAGVALSCVDHTSPSTPVVEVSARYVVGCDGANSTVRTLIGAPVHDLGFFHDWLIVDVVLHDQERVFDPISVQICDPARPSTAVSGGPGRRRWEFMRLPHEQLADLDSVDAAWAFLGPWDVRPDNATLERHAVYTFQARWVEEWRRGRVFLAGDAAHQMPPFAGQGMCSGLRDAANLAWKLDLVLDGRADDALLDTYATEREDNVRRVIDFSMALGQVICVPDEAEAAARDEAMAAGVVEGHVAEVPPLPGLTKGLIADGSPYAGAVFVQGRVAGPHGGEPVRFDDRHGLGWRVVAASGAAADVDAALAADADLGTWWYSIGGRVVGIGPEDDVDATYAHWFDKRGVTAAIQRPDTHLYATASDAEGAVDQLRALRSRLRS